MALSANADRARICFGLFRENAIPGGNAVKYMQDPHGTTLLPNAGYTSLDGLLPKLVIQCTDHEDQLGRWLHLPNESTGIQPVHSAVE